MLCSAVILGLCRDGSGGTPPICFRGQGGVREEEEEEEEEAVFCYVIMPLCVRIQYFCAPLCGPAGNLKRLCFACCACFFVSHDVLIPIASFCVLTLVLFSLLCVFSPRLVFASLPAGARYNVGFPSPASTEAEKRNRRQAVAGL